MTPKPRLVDSEPRTVLGIQRAERLPGAFTPSFDSNGERAGNGYFKGRPIIGRDTRINGGVYIGANSREAIVVDDRKYPPLAQAYGLLKESLTKAQPRRFSILNRVIGPKPLEKLSPLEAAQAAYGYTQQLMPTNGDVVKEIGKTRKDKKVSITGYFNKGGVCRHHALLNAYFIEKMIDEGLLQGEVHVERNTAVEGAHAWARFTPVEGDQIIVDSAQNFVGTPTQAQEEAVFWNYTPTPLPPPPSQ